MISLCSKNECTGCWACKNACPHNAIEMKADKEGFFYPIIHQECCVECKLCQRVCPVLNPITKYKKASNPIAVIAKSENLRMKSSSGGAFSVLALWILEQGGVVFGASFDRDYNVIHTKVHEKKDLDLLRGSKYVQSKILDCYREAKNALEEDKYVLFTGTPCQISGLLGFLRNKEYLKLYTVDLVCHGVPSQKAFHLYLEKLVVKKKIQNDDIEGFSFRDLKNWNVTPFIKLVGQKEPCRLSVDRNIYMLLFLSSRLHRYSCYNCKFSTQERIGDITIADFWGIGAVKPFNYDISKGCSLVLLNSSKGKFLFEQIKQDINYEYRQWEEALNDNTQLHASSICPKDRDSVYTYIENHSYEEIYNHFFNTPWFRTRHFLGRIIDFFHLRWILIKLLNR